VVDVAVLSCPFLEKQCEIKRHTNIPNFCFTLPLKICTCSNRERERERGRGRERERERVVKVELETGNFE
jgi:hypothetical protein